MANPTQQRIDQLKQSGTDYLFTPDLSSQLYVEYIEHLQNSPAINWGCKTLDNRKLTPQRPGQVTVIVGRPGNAKTSLLISIAKRVAKQCDRSKGECVVYVTWEESIESIESKIQAGRYTSEQLAFDKIDLDVIKAEAVKRTNLPLIVMGKSIMQKGARAIPPLTVSKGREAILALYYELGLKPVLILGDYIQKVPREHNMKRSDDVTESMFALSELSKDIKAPICLAAQATRDVDNQGLPIPTLSGAQWASAIEQEAFRMLGIMRPITVSLPNGKTLEHIDLGKQSYKVNENLLLLRLLKQRDFMPQQKTFALHFDPARFLLGDLTQQQAPANGSFKYVRQL